MKPVSIPPDPYQVALKELREDKEEIRLLTSVTRQLERELNAANERINRLGEALDRITFYAQTGILQDSFDEIKRIAKETKP